MSRQHLPTISVIIPTYNSAAYLPDCLSTIRKQEYPNIEVIIIDNCSTDDTRNVVASYSGIVNSFISEPDSGQPEAVTKGLRLATGEIVHWHSADDIVMPGAFHRVAREFVNNPEVDLVFSDGIAFDTTSIHAGAYVRWVKFWTALLFFGRFQSDCAYWRNRITRQALPLDDSKPLNCDEDFFLRLWVGHHHKWIPQPLGAFRIRPGQLSEALSKANLENDRRDTRSRIFLELGLTPQEIGRLRRQWYLSYMIGTCLLPRAKYASRFAIRKLTLGYRRKQLANWFYQEWLRHDFQI